jgi:hypothetical protein
MSPAEPIKPASRQWRCATCGISVHALHCPGCGEKMVEAKDLTFTGLMSQVFQTVTSVDGRLLRSLRVLVTRRARGGHRGGRAGLSIPDLSGDPVLHLEAHVEEPTQSEREHHDHAEEQPGHR